MNDEPKIDASGADRASLRPPAPKPEPKPAPARKVARRSKGAKGTVVVFTNFFLSGVLVVCIAGFCALLWGRGTFEGAGPLAAETTVVIPRNSRSDGIAASLERAGVIRDATVFQVGLRAAGAAGKLKAGEYSFEPGISMRGVMDKIVAGDSITHPVAIPEGWTVRQIFDRLAAEDVLAGDLPPMPPEGSLRPDTYPVERGTQRADLVRRMQEAQTELVASVWQKRGPDLPLRDIGQFVTLASIVEKETGKPDERPRVASVFVNRLKKGMRLDSDPTFLYGVYGGAGKPSGAPVTAADKASDTPYNTYKIKGLPPGPIACPGRAALEAVADPAAGKDVYFVADGDGGHVFASTLAEHNANVRRYRETMSRRNDAATEALGLDDAVAAQ